MRWIINAANIATGVRFAFERDVMGDYVVGRVSTAATKLRVAEAVASSAAVPGALAPFEVKASFPCAQGRKVELLDGGAYDNMGLQALDGERDAFLVAINAGGHFRTGNAGKIPLVRELQRANAPLPAVDGDQAAAHGRALQGVGAGAGLEGAAPEWGRQGVLFSLASDLPNVSPKWTAGAAVVAAARDGGGALAEELALVATSFDRSPLERCRAPWGWWLAGATISTYHPDLLRRGRHGGTSDDGASRLAGSASSGTSRARDGDRGEPPAAPELAARKPSYVVVDEIVGDAVGVAIHPWPLADHKGRLRFTDYGEGRFAGTSLAALQAWVDDHRVAELAARRHPQPRRSPRGRSRSATCSPRRPTPRARASRRRLLLGADFVDLTIDAREAAKLAFYGAVGPPLAEDEAPRWIDVHEEDDEPPTATGTPMPVPR